MQIRNVCARFPNKEVGFTMLVFAALLTLMLGAGFVPMDNAAVMIILLALLVIFPLAILAANAFALTGDNVIWRAYLGFEKFVNYHPVFGYITKWSIKIVFIALLVKGIGF